MWLLTLAIYPEVHPTCYRAVPLPSASGAGEPRRGVGSSMGADLNTSTAGTQACSDMAERPEEGGEACSK